MPSDRNHPENDSSEGDLPLPNSSADDFFHKMNRQFRRPKPSEEAVAAALQAIQTLAGEVVTNDSNPPEQEPLPVAGAQCPKCGRVNAEFNRFCGFCGAVAERTQTLPAKPMGSAGPAPGPTMPGQHLYHHHYHHHYFPPSDSPSETSQDETASLGTPPSEGARLALRQLVEDWVLQSNAKSFDQLAALYCGDAILVRPDATLLRGRASIRQYLETAIDAGLRNVQLELTDTRLLGGVACLVGVSRLQVPASARGAQERTGKFLMLVRYESPNWRILADVWCMNRDPFPAANPSAAQTVSRERRRQSW